MRQTFGSTDWHIFCSDGECKEDDKEMPFSQSKCYQMRDVQEPLQKKKKCRELGVIIWGHWERHEQIEKEKGWQELRKRARYCGWRGRVREKREGAGGRQEYMKASCINGKVKSRLRINYPVSPGITNVIIWTRVLIRMCRGVEDPLNKMGDRDRAGRV